MMWPQVPAKPSYFLKNLLTLHFLYLLSNKTNKGPNDKRDLVDSFYKVPSSSRETNFVHVHWNDKSAQILYKWLHQRNNDQNQLCEKSFNKLESLLM